MQIICGESLLRTGVSHHAFSSSKSHCNPLLTPHLRTAHNSHQSIRTTAPTSFVVYAATNYGGRGPRMDRNNPRRNPKPVVPMNEFIQASEVRLLDEAKEPLGVVAIADALAMARNAGVDLVMVVSDASPPVCRLIDYSKYNYELTKAAKDAKKKQRESVIETKELKLRPATDVHDYQVKLRAAQKFLLKGARVKLTLQFRGREMEFKGIGREMFDRFVDDLGGADAISIEQAPQMQGRQMNMVLGPKKEVLQ